MTDQTQELFDLSEADLRKRAIQLDLVNRVEFVFPNLTAQTFDLLTLTTRELNGAVITSVGIDSPEWDIFDGMQYLFTTQRVQPTGMQLRSQDGPAAAQIQQYNFSGVGPTESPTPVRVALRAFYVWSIIILGRAGVPATGFRVANLFVRTVAYLLR